MRQIVVERLGPKLPKPLFDHAVVRGIVPSHDGVLVQGLYVIGGCSSQPPPIGKKKDHVGGVCGCNQPSDSLFVFVHDTKPDDNSVDDGEHEYYFETRTSLPSPRYRHAAASGAGKIWVFGGCGESGESVGTVDVYDPIHDSWKVLLPAPEIGYEKNLIGYGNHLTNIVSPVALPIDTGARRIVVCGGYDDSPARGGDGSPTDRCVVVDVGKSLKSGSLTVVKTTMIEEELEEEDLEQSDGGNARGLTMITVKGGEEYQQGPLEQQQQQQQQQNQQLSNSKIRKASTVLKPLKVPFMMPRAMAAYTVAYGTPVVAGGEGGEGVGNSAEAFHHYRGERETEKWSTAGAWDPSRGVVIGGAMTQSRHDIVLLGGRRDTAKNVVANVLRLDPSDRGYDPSRAWDRRGWDEAVFSHRSPIKNDKSRHRFAAGSFTDGTDGFAFGGVVGGKGGSGITVSNEVLRFYVEAVDDRQGPWLLSTKTGLTLTIATVTGMILGAVYLCIYRRNKMLEQRRKIMQQEEVGQRFGMWAKGDAYCDEYVEEEELEDEYLYDDNSHDDDEVGNDFEDVDVGGVMQEIEMINVK